jgi:hypothetical protein
MAKKSLSKTDNDLPKHKTRNEKAFELSQNAGKRSLPEMPKFKTFLSSPCQDIFPLIIVEPGANG